jgi:hypothetical protein
MHIMYIIAYINTKLYTYKHAYKVLVLLIRAYQSKKHMQQHYYQVSITGTVCAALAQ